MLRHLLITSLLLFPLPALALTPAPAVVHLTLTDDNHHPLPNISISLAPSDPSLPAQTLTTNAAGQTTFTQSLPNATFWNTTLTINTSNFLPYTSTLFLFSNADIDLPLRLRTRHTTTITLLGPDNHPLPHVPLTLFAHERGSNYSPNTFHDPTMSTNDRGQFTWSHPDLDTPITLRVANRLDHIPDAPTLTVTLTPEELRFITPASSLDLTLLNPDGTPAPDWLVADAPQRISGGGMIIGIVIMEDQYATPRWLHLSSTASLSIPNPAPELLLLSPEGLPLIYRINPPAWPPGPHKISLTLPGISTTLSGQLLDASRHPVPNRRLYPQAINDGLGREFHITPPGPNTYADALIGPFENLQLPRITTDATGRFSIPLRFGMIPDQWRVDPAIPGNDAYLDPQPGTAPILTLHESSPSSSNTPPAVLKDLILQFLDPDGKPIPADDAPWIDAFVPTPNPTNNSYGQSATTDRRGRHYFVSAAAQSVHLETKEEFYKSITRDFPLTQADTQTLTIQLTAADRYPPISGQLLDAANHPVPDARVALADIAPPSNNFTDRRRDFPHLYTTTDANGRFTLPAAPLPANLYVSSASWDLSTPSTLPTLDPIPLPDDRHDLTIHLPPVGHLRILLPAAISSLSSTPYLLSSATNKPVASLRFDPATHSLTSDPLPPGDYHLSSTSLPELTDPLPASLSAAADKTTTIDLSAAHTSPSNNFLPATLTLTANGQPLSGAEVIIFADRPSRSSDSTVLTMDLSDPAGLVHFSAPPNTPCLALARQRGKYEALLEFQITPTAAALTLPLAPAAPPPTIPRTISRDTIPTTATPFKDRILFYYPLYAPWSNFSWGLTP